MSGITRKQEDILRLVASKSQIGTQNLNYQMAKYISGKSANGAHIINLEETWQKIKLAARIIAAVEEPSDIIVVSARVYGQRAVVKFSEHIKAISCSTARWTPGTLTNQNTGKFLEPRLLIVTDPRSDRQAIIEASYANIPCIALCDADSPLDYVDVAIPCSNRTTESISMIYWLIAREVKILRGELKKDENWDYMVDLYYYKNVEDDVKPETEEEKPEDEQQAQQKEVGEKDVDEEDKAEW